MTTNDEILSPAKKAWITRKAREVARKVRNTHKWSMTMTKWLITRTNNGVTWQLVEFLGPGGKESRGIVDLIAIRKNHSAQNAPLKRGDLFEIVIIQVKGGSARWPSGADIKRLRATADHHNAKLIVLAEWKKGKQPNIYRLCSHEAEHVSPRESWILVPPHEVFG